MQMENMKRNINLGAGGESRGGSTAGRSRLASAVGRTVSSAPPRQRGFPLRRMGLAAVAALMLFAARPSSAGAAVPPIYWQIQVALNSGNAARTQWAVRQIEALPRGGGCWGAVQQMRYTWLKEMMGHHIYAGIVKTTKLGMLATPVETNIVIYFLRDRVEALRLMGRPAAALRNAKMLFDVDWIGDAGNAALQVYDCLRAQKPNGAKLARDFRREQIAGSQPPNPGRPPKTCTVLAGIAIHGRAYARHTAYWFGEGVMALVGRGNLWLLADRPNKALQCFKTAYDMVPPGQLGYICDRIAAAMRAKYGTIGAANAWLKSLAK